MLFVGLDFESVFHVYFSWLLLVWLCVLDCLKHSSPKWLVICRAGS